MHVTQSEARIELINMQSKKLIIKKLHSIGTLLYHFQDFMIKFVTLCAIYKIEHEKRKI